MLDIVQPCVLYKGGDVMPRPTSSDCMCYLRAVLACHARRFRSCVMSKGGDVMPRPMLMSVCAFLVR